MVLKNSHGRKYDKPLDAILQLASYGIVFFIFLSDGFELIADNNLGKASILKRILQIFIGVPILLIAFGVLRKPMVLGKPFVLFVILKLVIDAAYGAEIIFFLENFIILVTLISIHTLPIKNIELIIRLWIRFSVIFASAALVKITICIFFPGLINSPTLDFLGRSTELIEIGPFSFGRSSSFATEPSLNVLFFLMPAIASMLVNDKVTRSFVILIVFCILSFSGSIFLSLIVALVILIILIVFKLLDVRFFFPFLFLGVFVLYLGILSNIGNSNFSENFDFSQVNDAFNKSSSFEIRAVLASRNVQALFNNPFGLSFSNTEVENIPGPLLVSVGIAGGWVSIILFVYFFFIFGDKMNQYRQFKNSSLTSNISIALLLGAMFNFVVFNDYLIINFTGLVVLSFFEFLLKQKTSEFILKKI